MKIGAVERITGISAQTIRYYESKGLLAANRQENGYREYDEEAVLSLQKIRFLREVGISLTDIRLWKDRVVSTEELLRKRMRELDDSDKRSEKQREWCSDALRSPLLFGELQLRGEFQDEEKECVPEEDEPLALGIDLGTTTISAQLISLRSGTAIHTYSIAHNAEIVLPNAFDAYAADAEKLVERTERLAASICGEYRNVKAIGLTGQMHGIVCLRSDGRILSPLYTWQNEFGLRQENGQSFCENFTQRTGVSVATGYGLLTYDCLRKLRMLPAGTAYLATVMDVAAMRLCGAEKPVIHATNAASLGLFDLNAMQFDRNLLRRAEIEEKLLPEVRSGFTLAGHYAVPNDRRAVPVSCAIGDNQAGVFGSLRSKKQILVNIGTSSQVSRIGEKEGDGLEQRPYPDGGVLSVGCALCGGRAYAALAEFFAQSFLGISGHSIEKNEVYRYMNALAEQNYGSEKKELTVDTRFCGTRSDGNVRGGVTGLEIENFTPAHFVLGTLRGIAEELKDLAKHLLEEPVESVVVSGNAVRKNRVLQKIVGDVFGAEPLVPQHTEEAAYGAALYAAVSAGILSREEASERIQYQLAKEKEQ